MRIAQISQLYEPVPPPFYGGTERVVSWITEELVACGHEVTLFASGDLVTKAKLDAIIPRAIRNSDPSEIRNPDIKDASAVYVRLLETVYREAKSFDILHFHIDALPFPLFSRQSRPFLTTLHGRLDLPEYREVYQLFPKVPLVSVSKSQRSPNSGS